jgi:protein-S-isoprenylcysteine O-methyltransferase Ste14
MGWLETRVPPPVVAGLVAVLMWLLSDGLHFGGAWSWAAAVFAIAGGAIALSGEVEFLRAKTTVNPMKPALATQLVTGGIYNFSRNPMYVGMAFLLLGWAAFLATWWLLLLGPALFVAYITRYQIMPEEQVLGAKFGDAYREYAGRVRRWI